MAEQTAEGSWSPLALLGGVFWLVGAAGLVWSGRCVVNVLLVLTGLSINVHTFELAAAAALLLALGIVLWNWNRSVAGPLQRCVGGGCGIGMLLGGALICWTMLETISSFTIMANSASAPKVSELEAGIALQEPWLMAGHALWCLTGIAAVLAVVMLKWRTIAVAQSDWQRVLGIGIVLFLLLFAGGWIAILLHARALDHLIDNGGNMPVKPAELASHLMSIFQWGLINGLASAVAGALLVLQSMLTAGPSPTNADDFDDDLPPKRVHDAD
ncbi:MAG: hypothetical protein KDA58_12285 [Planctomycetaceae bacterium]|nr:hypothetical protein [Planctomycetaceae bacterium]